MLALGRWPALPAAPFGPVQSGIRVVDRYQAYQAIDKVQAGLIVRALCWAHQRRDFLDVAWSWPPREDWARSWVAPIHELDQRNDARGPGLAQPKAFAQAAPPVGEQVSTLAKQAAAELSAPPLQPAQQAVLESRGNHWTGWTGFVEPPEGPLDNHTAERAARGPVVGRQNYYGSGSRWSGPLAAMLFSWLQRLALWNRNPRVWRTEDRPACVQAGGPAPKDVGPLRPWNLSPPQRPEGSLAKEKAGADSSGKRDRRRERQTPRTQTTSQPIRTLPGLAERRRGSHRFRGPVTRRWQAFLATSLHPAHGFAETLR